MSCAIFLQNCSDFCKANIRRKIHKFSVGNALHSRCENTICEGKGNIEMYLVRFSRQKTTNKLTVSSIDKGSALSVLVSCKETH